MHKINLDAFEREPIQGHTSKGDQPKWHINDTWYKADHMGYEGLAETLISEMLKKSNVKNFVEYKPVLIQNNGTEKTGCASRSLKAEDEMLIPFERLHRAYKGKGLSAAIATLPDPREKILYTVDFIERVTGLTEVGPYITLLLELDAFTLNEDRHTNNLAVIRNNDTKEFRLCPIFDNGLSFLSDLNDYPLDKDTYTCIKHVQAKPFDSSFDAQLDAAEDLYGIHLKFSFNRDDIPDLLSSLCDIYDSDIIGRVESVLLEQMRKYKIFF